MVESFNAQSLLSYKFFKPVLLAAQETKHTTEDIMESTKRLLHLFLVALAVHLTSASRIRDTFTYFGHAPAPSPVLSFSPIFKLAPAPSPEFPYFPITIQYEIVDNSTSPGNTRFEKIGRRYAIGALRSANEFVLKTLNQKIGEGKGYRSVLLVVESFAKARIGFYPGAVASTVDNNIRFNSDYLQGFPGDAKSEFTGILYHESTHVWQWTGQGTAPDGLINGIADYVRLTAGWPASDWGKRGSGFKWDQGYEVTAYFLEYCESIMQGFVPKLNAMMEDRYSDNFFVKLLGKSVDELWSDYKLAYASPAPSPVPGY